MTNALKSSVKRILMLTLIAALLLPASLAFAEDPADVRYSFTDTDGHWGKKHITKIALLGFAGGYPEGDFRPNNQISQQEAVVMLINMMGLKGELDFGSEMFFSIDVTSYAKPYVYLALSKRLISLAEEEPNATNWGTRPATREWIAKLIVRALGKQAEADGAMLGLTGFTDEASIGTGYAGYINIAKLLGIVSGMPDGRFAPKETVTRAQMAVFLGNSESLLPVRSEQIVSGYVVSFNGATLLMQQSGGAMRTLSVSPDAGLYAHDSNDALTASDIRPDQFVNVIQMNNVAYYIETSEATEQFETVEGTFVSLSPDTQLITMLVGNETKSYRYATDAAVTTAAGAGLSLTSIPAESELQLKRVAGGVNGDYTAIIVKSSPVYATVRGTVEAIVTGSRSVEVLDAATSTKALYEIPASVAIKKEDRELSGVGELYVGDEVEIELKNDAVVAFEVVKSSVTLKEGKVSSVDAKEKIIYISGDQNTYIGYRTIASPEVIVDGLTGAGLADVQPADEVTLQLNASNNVTRIIVKNRSVEAVLGLEFERFRNGYIIAFNKDVPVTFRVDQSVLLSSNGIAIPYEQIEQYFTQGKKIDITYTGDRLLTMALSNSYVGTVTQINTTARTIQLDADPYGPITLSYLNIPSVQIFGKPTAQMSDIKTGDKVTILLDNNQERAIAIQLMQDIMLKVTSKVTGKLVVATESGATYDLLGAASARFTHDYLDHPTYNDVVSGQYLYAKFKGTSVTDIHLSTVRMGTITSIDAAGSAITLNEYGKTVVTLPNMTNVKIDRNGVISTSFSALAVGDRVVVVSGKDGYNWVSVISPVTKKLVSYTSTSRTVQFTVVTLNEAARFTLHDMAYVHKAGQSINLSSLARNTELKVYFWEDQIVEIEQP